MSRELSYVGFGLLRRFAWCSGWAKCIAVALLVSGHAVSRAEAESDSIRVKYGAYVGFNVNVHTANFNKLSGIPNCCPNFESGSGTGFNLGVVFEHRVARQWWVGSRVGVIFLNGTLTREEPTTILVENGPADGVFEHRLTGKFLHIAFEPSVLYNPIERVFISFGPRLGVNLTKSGEQVEMLVKPAGVGTFLDSLGNDTHKRTRNEYSGEIPDALPFQAALHVGVGYQLPLNRRGNLVAVPEISYHVPLTELVKNTQWRVANLRMSVALKYALLPQTSKDKLFRRELNIDTLKIPSDIVAQNQIVVGVETSRRSTVEMEDAILETEILERTDTLFYPHRPKLTGDITAVGVDSTGREIPNPVFNIEEFISNRLDPLLNYIFFEGNSSELPPRYVRLSREESSVGAMIDSLSSESALDTYHNILNIIGKRMREHPNATLTLIGCNSGIGVEKNNLTLSRKRAETVRDYLVDVWGISPGNITVQARNLPENASTPIDEPDKIAENRRVEIYSDNEEILKPVFIQKIHRTANPPIVRFKLSAHAEAGLKRWDVEAWQSLAPKERFVRTGGEFLPQSLDWVLENDQHSIPKHPAPIHYSLRLWDSRNNDTHIVKQTAPIDVITVVRKRREQIEDYEIERFSLILFDFDKAEIVGSNSKVVDFIASRTRPESQIEIRGYTDRTGDEMYNQQLSERRALATKAALNRSDAVAIGIGERQLLYDNDLPEGRFYCRTVQVTVKTKVK